jgi:hypothetical protein
MSITAGILELHILLCQYTPFRNQGPSDSHVQEDHEGLVIDRILYSNDRSSYRGWKLAFDSISTDQFIPSKSEGATYTMIRLMTLSVCFHPVLERQSP